MTTGDEAVIEDEEEGPCILDELDDIYYDYEGSASGDGAGVTMTTEMGVTMEDMVSTASGSGDDVEVIIMSPLLPGNAVFHYVTTATHL
jgi:hypothetical protein